MLTGALAVFELLLLCVPMCECPLFSALLCMFLCTFTENKVPAFYREFYGLARLFLFKVLPFVNFTWCRDPGSSSAKRVRKNFPLFYSLFSVFRDFLRLGDGSFPIVPDDCAAAGGPPTADPQTGKDLGKTAQGEESK